MEAQNRQLPEWFNRVRNGQLRLPRFQRFEAWGSREVSGLLETILRGLPAGATLILQVGNEEPFHSRTIEGAPEPTERATEHLLDGQQRLTALWRSFHDLYEDRSYFVRIDADGSQDAEEQPIIHSQARWERDGKKMPLWADKPTEVWKRKMVPMRLLRPGEIFGEIQDWCRDAAEGDPEQQGDALSSVLRLREAVTSFNVPFLSLPIGTPKHVALDVFIKMNTSAVRLSAFDIVVAEVEGTTGESLHQLVHDLEAQVPAIEAYGGADDLILSIQALREDKQPTQRSFHELDYNRMVAEWPVIVDGVRWLVELLESQAIFDAQRLPTVGVLPVIAAVREHADSALDGLGNARALIQRYIWRASLGGRYDQAAGSKALQDARAIRDALKGDGDPSAIPALDEELHPFPTVEELLRARWPKTRDSLARAIMAISLRSGGLDFADGAPATRESVHTREYHHLFPDALLTGSAMGGMESHRSYRALNCALVTWNTNRNIAAKEPMQYLLERVAKSDLGETEVRRRLDTHLVPYDQLACGGYAAVLDGSVRASKIAEDYERFLQARAELVRTAARGLWSA